MLNYRNSEMIQIKFLEKLLMLDFGESQDILIISENVSYGGVFISLHAEAQLVPKEDTGHSLLLFTLVVWSDSSLECLFLKKTKKENQLLEFI